VHRLVNASDDWGGGLEERGTSASRGGGASSASTMEAAAAVPLSAGKIVEVPDLNNPSLERGGRGASASPSPPGVAGDEGAVHLKLEGWAGRYNSVLKEQMRRQRLFYEERIENVQREYGARRPAGTSARELVTALKREKNSLEQRAASLSRKYREVNRELTLLRDMNEGLEANRLPLEQKLRESEGELQKVRKDSEMKTGLLEEKVKELMMKLTSV